MANRPSTAEILAAARGSDGNRGGTAVAEPPPVRKAIKRKDSEPAVETKSVVETEPAVTSAVAEHSPPSVASIVAAVRQVPESANGSPAIPPSIGSILKQIREDGSVGPTAPPSMARILADVRGTQVSSESAVTSAAGSRSDRKTSVANAGNKSPKRGKTADILAAARRQGGGGKAGDAKKPPAARPSGTAAILAAARKQGAVGTPAKPSETSEKPAAARPSGTAAILAAARKQGSAAGSASGKTAPKRKTASASNAVAAGQRSVSVVDGAESADNRPRPARISEILARVRCDSDQESAPLELELPSVGEMVAALRRQAGERRREEAGRRESVHWTARLRTWFGGRGDRIAVRQFDHS